MSQIPNIDELFGSQLTQVTLPRGLLRIKGLGVRVPPSAPKSAIRTDDFDDCAVPLDSDHRQTERT